MKRTLTLVLCLSMMLSMLASCGSDSSDTADGTVITSSEGSGSITTTDSIKVDLSQEPEGVISGTAVRIAVTNDFASELLPYANFGARYFYSYVYDTLFWDENNDGCTDTPLLVESYTISEDGLTYVLNLYEDIYFQNGNKLNAASVIGSLDFYNENGLGSATIGDIKTYEATGEYQVTVELTTVGAETAKFLAVYIFDHTSYEEYGYNSDAALGAGSGPYEITSYAIGNNVVLEAVEDCWHDGRQAHIETVTMEIISNTTTVFSAIASGDLEFAVISDYSSYELLMGSEDLNIISTDSEPATIWINVDGSCEYLSNPVVREALCMLIDDEQVMLASTGGYGTVNTNPINLEFSEFYSHDRVYDPDVALAMLEAEGIDPSDIVITPIVSSLATAPYSNIQSQLMEYGITLDFTATDPNVVFTQGLAGEWDFWAEQGGLTASKSSYSGSIVNIWSIDAAQAVVTDPEIKIQVGDMVEEALTLRDIDDFYEELADICQILDENFLYLCSWQGLTWNVFDSNIQNPVVDTSLGQWRVYESWLA